MHAGVAADTLDLRGRFHACEDGAYFLLHPEWGSCLLAGVIPLGLGKPWFLVARCPSRPHQTFPFHESPGFLTPDGLRLWPFLRLHFKKVAKLGCVPSSPQGLHPQRDGPRG